MTDDRLSMTSTTTTTTTTLAGGRRGWAATLASVAARAATAARSRVGWTTLALAAILCLAAALRLRGVSWGLPFSYQDADENVIVTHAFGAAQGHVDPHFFYYPSLLFYAVAALYRVIGVFYHPHFATSFFTTRSMVVDPTPYYLAARLLVVSCGIASVYLVYAIGRDAYSRGVGLLAALFLAVEPLHVRYSHVAVTDVPATALGLASLLFLLRATRRRSGRDLLIGALFAGLATSTKYNLGLLVLPAVTACWFSLTDPARRRGVLAFAGAAARRVVAPMAVAFLVATPFAVLDAPRFIRDFTRQNHIVAHGWLGFEHAGSGYWYNLAVNLTGSLGLLLLALGVFGLLLALARRTRADLVLAPFVVVYYLYVSSWHELMDRYMLPIVPLLLLLAARLCVRFARAPVARRRLALAGVAVFVVVAIGAPLTSSVSYSLALSGTDVRSVAKDWVERHVAADSAIASDPYGPPLVGRRALRFYRAAGAEAVAYRIYRLPLPLPAQPDHRHSLAWLKDHGVGYVIVSSDVYDRVLAARDAYPDQVRFYRRLAATAHLVRTFAPGPDHPGPTLKLYRL